MGRVIPVIVPDADCHCGLRHWQRYPGSACTVVACSCCGYVAVIVTGAA